MPLRCANQACSYYERNKDLDLDSQKFILSGHECFLILNLVGVIRPFASEKYRVDNLRVPFRPEKLEPISKKSDAAEEMHRPGGFRNTARWLKSNRKLVE